MSKENFLRIETQAVLESGKMIDTSIVIKKDTSIAEVKDDPSKCVVFVEGHSITIAKPYKEIQLSINSLSI